jgi:hypothetical protein
MGLNPISSTKKERNMSLEKDRYYAGLKEIEERIGAKKTILYQTEREIRDLERDYKNAEDSCRHNLIMVNQQWLRNEDGLVT